MPKGYPLGLTPAVLEGLGGEEGVQVDAELAAEAADGARAKMLLGPRLRPAVKGCEEGFAAGWDLGFLDQVFNNLF